MDHESEVRIYGEEIPNVQELGLLRRKQGPQDVEVISKSKGPSKQFEISVLRHYRFVVLRKKQPEQPNFTNDYVI